MQFEKRLLKQRQELLKLDESETTTAVELDQSRIGRLSRMGALQDQAMSAEARRRRHAALQSIDAALRRMDEGEYGSCVNCGETIAYGRLELDPAIELCVDCANALERESP